MMVAQQHNKTHRRILKRGQTVKDWGGGLTTTMCAWCPQYSLQQCYDSTGSGEDSKQTDSNQVRIRLAQKALSIVATNWKR